MLQEDPTNELSFEIVEHKDSPVAAAVSPLAQSMPQIITSPLGGIVPPPMDPSGGMTKSWSGPFVTVPAPKPLPPNLQAQGITTAINIEQQNQMPPPPPSINPVQFSAAIPPNKGIPINAPIPETNEGNSSLFGWMRDAVSSNEILSKVAEKAINSVGSIITTLDPQMGEYIHATGNINISIVSGSTEETDSIRDAIYSVIGNASIKCVSELEKNYLTIGIDAGFEAVANRIQAVQSTSNVPTIAVENVLYRQNNFLFDTNVIMLIDNANNITLTNISQCTPIPIEQFLKQADLVGCSKNLPDDQRLATFLKLKPNWQEYVTGITRREIITLATKAVMKIYKQRIGR